MPTEACITDQEKHLLDWLDQAASKGLFIFKDQQQPPLPVPWVEFILLLTSLQSRGILNCNIREGRICEVSLLSQNKNGLHSAEKEENLEILFVPSDQTILRLKQYGFSKGEINDLLHNYRKFSFELTDQTFLSFCLKTNKKVFNSLTTLQSHWVPSQAARDILTGHGIAEDIQAAYLKLYIHQHSDKCIDKSNWDDHYLDWFCSKWSQKNRTNPRENVTSINSEWSPSTNTIHLLMAEGISHAWLIIEIQNFRLYWCETDTKKSDWDAEFCWWAKREWQKELNGWDSVLLENS